MDSTASAGGLEAGWGRRHRAASREADGEAGGECKGRNEGQTEEDSQESDGKGPRSRAGRGGRTRGEEEQKIRR